MNDTLKTYIAANTLTYFIETYGCQMNTHDSEKIAGILSELGYLETQDKYRADILIFNTCCVRENAENKLFGNVGHLKAHKETRKNMLLGVCGCMMQQPGKAEKLKKTFPYVDILFGTTNMDELPGMIEAALLKKEGTLLIEDRNDLIEDIAIKRSLPPLASVSIMQGCNNFCSFCIVPYVRGRERSRTPEVIVDEVKALKEAGYKEVMLLGQNVNSYGGEAGSVRFPKLLEMVAATGIPRIRFMTSHPKDASIELFQVMAAHENICKQLHLPVQSGSSRVLKEMNRKYTRERYLALINEARALMPGLVITTDIMIGFPGETEEEFEETLSLVEEVRFDAAFTFVYSKRSGTKAAEMEAQISEAEKQRRITRLVALQAEITYEKNKEDVGKHERILIEGKSTRDIGSVSGKTDGGKMVNMIGEDSLVGSFVDVKIITAKKTTLLGERI
ncbi:MAG: tRNA (N6-isopentenyl adenosine(37)-C2)-methylthiotransferase MiaB [Christensenellaceae bacterium]|jgi:tRNA-2-methylthio-N6-dimethylallyladenosine synthase